MKILSCQLQSATLRLLIRWAVYPSLTRASTLTTTTIGELVLVMVMPILACALATRGRALRMRHLEFVRVLAGLSLPGSLHSS
eukprot:5653552-Amphidinium_carterae.1